MVMGSGTGTQEEQICQSGRSRSGTPLARAEKDQKVKVDMGGAGPVHSLRPQPNGPYESQAQPAWSESHPREKHKDDSLERAVCSDLVF